jgi:hypothetical protein
MTFLVNLPFYIIVEAVRILLHKLWDCMRLEGMGKEMKRINILQDVVLQSIKNVNSALGTFG